MTGPKVLLFDLETAPATVFTFQLYQPIIGIDQIIEDSRIISWSAKWLGDRRVITMDEYHEDRGSMLAKMWELLDKADVIIGYNSKRFDEPWIRGELIREGYPPFSPIRHIDLYQIAKSNFRLLSGKLDWLSFVLLNDRKVKNPGFSMWRDCLMGDDDAKRKAWALMRKYGKKDTALLEPIYEILRPWIKIGVPNFGLYSGDEFVCPFCGSSEVQKRGFAYTPTGKFQRYQCQSEGCYAWSRDPHRLATTELRPA